MKPSRKPDPLGADSGFEAEKQYNGSNNWVISGAKSASGYPMLANDPHRAQSTPSLRYWVHPQVAPGLECGWGWGANVAGCFDWTQ